MKIYDDWAARLRHANLFPITSRPVCPIDVGAITGTIERALASAGLDSTAGPLQGVARTMRNALTGAGLSPLADASTQRGATIDGLARESGTPLESDRAPLAPTEEQVLSGEFLTRSFSNNAGARAYKLYVPSSYFSNSRDAVPMIVMLHGCTQSPDDFAAGTRMNALAELHGFLVVYPAQAANANGSKCWNWFRTEDQSRDCGEPSLIAGITREVASTYRIDARRIFAAGLSAGAAMAIILGVTYPELYAAVGAHSGLPYGAAHDVPSAFGAMKGGGATGISGVAQIREAGRGRAMHAVPTIVFHGDSDHTVDARNGDLIVEQATMRRSNKTRFKVIRDTATAANGCKYTRTVYADAANQPIVEQWLLHGAGHAWSGGSEAGSFTYAGGPDASAEMIRFFYSQHRAGSA